MRPFQLGPPGFVLASQRDQGPFEAAWGSNWQTLWELDVTPIRGIEWSAWIDRHELVIVESIYAGRVSRTWSKDGVFISAPEARP